VFERVIRTVKENSFSRFAPGGICNSHSDDALLVARALQKDERAEIELISRHQQKAYAIAFHMCSGDCHEAQDIVQESFLKVFRNLHRFDGRSSFYTWFYRIVVNTCIDHRRRRHLKEKVFSFWRRQTDDEQKIAQQIIENHPDPNAHDNPLDTLHHKELGAAIGQLMESLPEKQRIVFQLKILEGLRIREIADILEMAEGTVKSHLFRAIKAARTALQAWKVD
jgi:RNA polymerase sigma-70 factor (ECF subfamily)